MTPPFQILKSEREAFYHSLITSFLVLTWTAYGLCLVCGHESIIRTLYPTKHAGNCSDHRVHCVTMAWFCVETCRSSIDYASGSLCNAEAWISDTGQFFILNLFAFPRFLCKNRQGSILQVTNQCQAQCLWKLWCRGQLLTNRQGLGPGQWRQLCLHR